LAGDPAFNQSCGLFKTFMAGREQNSVTANIPVTVSATGIVTPTATPNLADNNALPIPGVNADNTGAVRGTFPDIGAVEFTSSAPIDPAGPVVTPFTLSDLICITKYNEE
jgi:hypothetical protein